MGSISQEQGRVMNIAEEVAAPPHSPEAEKALLSSIIQSPGDAIPECVEKMIRPDVFFLPTHRTTYQSLLDMYDSGDAIDLITFTQYLRDRKLLDAIGGAAYVTELGTFVPTAANVEFYIDIVLDKYLLREIAATATETIRRAHEEQGEPASVLEAFESKLASLRSLRGGNGEYPEGVPLMTLAERKIDPANNVLGDRYLCRGGIMFFVGPSGVGKSSVSAQQDICWSLGRPAFHIRPERPLRILCNQAENDVDDLTEMGSGVVAGLKLAEQERETVRRNVFYVSDCSHTGEQFLRMLEYYLKKFAPIDIVRIDTLTAYIGGDLLSVEITSKFLRSGLSSLLWKYQCAAIVNHHTPKPTNIDKKNWRPSDWMYFGAGNADLTNAPRATLSMDSTHDANVFEFRAGKRGRRIGWIDEKGEPIFVRYFCWEKGATIFWRDATEEDIERVQSLTPHRGRSLLSTGTIEDLFNLIPPTGSIEKNVLIQHAADPARGEKRIGINKAKSFITELIDAGRAFPWRIKRPKTNDRMEISRHEQTLV
jgi:hypothetical protein